MKRIKSIFLVLLLLLTSFNLCSFTSSAATATGISVDKKYITIALGKKINVLPLIPNELAVDNKLNVNTTKGLIAKWDGNLYDAESKIVKGSAVEVTALKTGKQKLTLSSRKILCLHDVTYDCSKPQKQHNYRVSDSQVLKM